MGAVEVGRRSCSIVAAVGASLPESVRQVPLAWLFHSTCIRGLQTLVKKKKSSQREDTVLTGLHIGRSCPLTHPFLPKGEERPVFNNVMGFLRLNTFCCIVWI